MLWSRRPQGYMFMECCTCRKMRRSQREGWLGVKREAGARHSLRSQFPNLHQPAHMVAFSAAIILASFHVQLFLSTRSTSCASTGSDHRCYVTCVSHKTAYCSYLGDAPRFDAHGHGSQVLTVNVLRAILCLITHEYS